MFNCSLQNTHLKMFYLVLQSYYTFFWKCQYVFCQICEPHKILHELEINLFEMCKYCVIRDGIWTKKSQNESKIKMVDCFIVSAVFKGSLSLWRSQIHEPIAYEREMWPYCEGHPLGTALDSDCEWYTQSPCSLCNYWASLHPRGWAASDKTTRPVHCAAD